MSERIIHRAGFVFCKESGRYWQVYDDVSDGDGDWDQHPLGGVLRDLSGGLWYPQTVAGRGPEGFRNRILAARALLAWHRMTFLDLREQAKPF